MNNYCVETSKVAGKNYERIEPEEAATYHLNGVQTVPYSRIRYTAGGDFLCSARQRTILKMIADQPQTMGVSELNKIADDVFPQISTNFTLAEMLGYLKDITEYKIGETIGFPEDNTADTLNEVGSVVDPVSLSQSVQDLHQFLFRNDGYTVSSAVQEIEVGINAWAVDKASGDSDTFEGEETNQYDYDSSGTGSSESSNTRSNSVTGTGGGTTDWSGTGTGGGADTGTGVVQIQKSMMVPLRQAKRGSVCCVMLFEKR